MGSEGANSPSTIVDDNTVGTVAWTNPSNAGASNDSYASAETVSSAVSHYLKATDFEFSIPSGAMINGILVEIERYASVGGNGGITDEHIRIVKSNGIIGNENKADTGTSWPQNDPNTYVSYGGSSDLWNESWAASDINNSNFGVVISADLNPTAAVSAKVDHIRITVYYTNPPTKINIGDTWKGIEGVQINIGDTWKTVSGMKINIGDTWKTIF